MLVFSRLTIQSLTVVLEQASPVEDGTDFVALKGRSEDSPGQSEAASAAMCRPFRQRRERFWLYEIHVANVVRIWIVNRYASGFSRIQLQNRSRRCPSGPWNSAFGLTFRQT